MVRRTPEQRRAERKPRQSRQPKDGQMNRDMMRVHQNAREQQTHDRLERLLAEVVRREAKPDFSRLDAIMELEEARMIALSSFPAQVAAAVAATKAKAEVMGLIVRKTKDMGKGEDPPLSATTEEQDEAVRERLLTRGLSRPAVEQFMTFLRRMRAVHRGDDPDAIEDDQNTIEGDPPEEIEE